MLISTPLQYQNMVERKEIEDSLASELKNVLVSLEKEFCALGFDNSNTLNSNHSFGGFNIHKIKGINNHSFKVPESAKEIPSIFNANNVIREIENTALYASTTESIRKKN